MTTEDLEALFEKHENKEYLKYEKIVGRTLPLDLHAFMLLNSLCPSIGAAVAAAEHDEIFLDPSLEYLAKVATEEIVIELLRCGVMVREDSLTMYV